MMSSLEFCLMVFHICVFSILCLSSPFPIISHRIVIRVRVGYDIVDCSCLLIVLATLDVVCWMTSMMVSLMVSMSSSSCSASSRFFNWSLNSIFFDPILDR